MNSETSRIATGHTEVPHILIIGGGFSGTLLAVHLLQKSTGPLRLTIVDRGSAPGRGTAYSATSSAFLLNVPAGRMSAFREDPEHFVRWLCNRKQGFNAEDFVPRDLYGSYVGEIFAAACLAHPEVSVSWIQDEAQALRRMEDGKPELELRRSECVRADLAVLATGTPRSPVPLPLQKLDKQILADHAWEEGALTGIPQEGRVLILGTGLSAVDQVAALTDQGFRGSILMLSRRGRLPSAHRAYETGWPAAWAETLPHTLNALVAAVRKEIQSAQEQHVDWRAVIDSLRAHVPALWSRLTRKDRSRFLRHVQVHWEAARHRMPQQLYALVQSLTEQQRLTIEAGSLLTAERCEQQVLIQYRKRGQTAVRTTQVDKIINCIGSSSVLGLHGHLVSRLLDDRLARPDSVGLGLEVAPDGALIPASDANSSRVYVIGPLRRASVWETTAVAEIRVQAAELADTLLQLLSDGTGVHT